jgi:hypothetical protein
MLEKVEEGTVGLLFVHSRFAPLSKKVFLGSTAIPFHSGWSTSSRLPFHFEPPGKWRHFKSSKKKSHVTPRASSQSGRE